MAVELRLPKLSDEMKEGVISRWLKQPGEKVSKGEPVAEVETEKVIVEINAENDGVILEHVAREQDVVPVGGVLCRIGAPGESAASARKPAPQSSQKPAPAKPSAPEPVPSARSGARDIPMEAAPAMLASAPASAAGSHAPPTSNLAVSNIVALVQPPEGDSAGAPPATPLARRIASQLGIDLSRVQGSGIGGKIVKTDLQSYLPRPGSQTVPRSAGSALTAESPLPTGVIQTQAAVPAQSLVTASRELPLSPLRRTIARRMAESKREIPHFYMSAEIDVTEVLELRKRLNEESGRRITVNDLIIKAAALALERVPEVNAEFADTLIRRHAEAHIGFAVSIEGGLVTPVVRDCMAKSIGRIATETAGLIERAKARRLQQAELEGGTFTISNMGMFDVTEFAAIINPPQVAILGVARPQEKPVVLEGRIAVRSRLTATLSADHRALDGVTAAAFLRELKAVLEKPVQLML
jgi:pyruvate dehydrogenase E2 component (dihydrolipoamide acetyltransferase)